MPNTHLPKLKDYLKGERQWPRHLRIAHAQFRLKEAFRDEDKQSFSFFTQVLKALGPRGAEWAKRRA